jgi:hypothetical protein
LTECALRPTFIGVAARRVLLVRYLHVVYTRTSGHRRSILAEMTSGNLRNFTAGDQS